MKLDKKILQRRVAEVQMLMEMLKALENAMSISEEVRATTAGVLSSTTRYFGNILHEDTFHENIGVLRQDIGMQLLILRENGIPCFGLATQLGDFYRKDNGELVEPTFFETLP